MNINHMIYYRYILYTLLNPYWGAGFGGGKNEEEGKGKGLGLMPVGAVPVAMFGGRFFKFDDLFGEISTKLQKDDPNDAS